MKVPDAPINLNAISLDDTLKIYFIHGLYSNSIITSYEYKTHSGLYFSPDIINNSFTIYGLINGHNNDKIYTLVFELGE
jgi:hypothetical protein